ncbi:hypothetical protein [Paraburkholderia elongata]|uniref:Integrase DNA-binding domain-containing protein n=1 Tax=Paraburkholderia elongata TaxID=2675747 RepID=A0A972SI60_9BURK|nr:hypothetical protein [Paraburkholderia elongata]NPT55724.1 hypothetical protein [Paraburkholderia elongata]
MVAPQPRWTATIYQAQERARSLQTLIDGGIDPREHEAEQKAAHEARQAAKHRQDVTVGEAWAHYLEHLRTKISPKTKKPRSERYITDHINLSSPGGGIAKRGGKEKVRGPLRSCNAGCPKLQQRAWPPGWRVK